MRTGCVVRRSPSASTAPPTRQPTRIAGGLRCATLGGETAAAGGEAGAASGGTTSTRAVPLAAARALGRQVRPRRPERAQLQPEPAQLRPRGEHTACSRRERRPTAERTADEQRWPPASAYGCGDALLRVCGGRHESRCLRCLRRRFRCGSSRSDEAEFDRDRIVEAELAAAVEAAKAAAGAAGAVSDAIAWPPEMRLSMSPAGGYVEETCNG